MKRKSFNIYNKNIGMSDYKNGGIREVKQFPVQVKMGFEK